MSSKIYQLQSKASPETLSLAERASAHLSGLGFESEDIDDLVYKLAERFTLEYRDEVGDTSAQRLGQAEYNAAEEINQMGMEQQLVVLCASCGSSGDFSSMLEQHLKLVLPADAEAA